MANSRWLGKAVSRKQVATLVIGGTWAGSDTVTLSIDGLDFVVAVGSLTSTAQVATTIKQLFEVESSITDTTAVSTPTKGEGGAKIVPQFREMTATVDSSTVTFTARTAGKPFTMSAAKSSTSGTISYTNAVTANEGKHEADNEDNLSAGAVLTDEDVFIVDSGNVDIKYGLSIACQLAEFRKSKSYTGNIGLPETNADDGSFTYPEYRTKYFTTDDDSKVTVAHLEEGSGQGSGRVRWDAGAGQAVINVYGRGTRAETGVPCILFIGTNASNELNNFAGDIGVAFYGGETATLAEVRHGDGEGSAAETFLGSGVTLSSASLTINGGTLTTNSAYSASAQNGGSHYHFGPDSSTAATTNVDGGIHYPMGSGDTYTTVRVGPDGTWDARKGTGPYTITNVVQLHKGSKFYDPQGRGTYSGGFKLNRCGLEDVVLVLASDKTYSLS